MEKITEEYCQKRFPPPGSEEYPEWDVCDDCPFPMMAAQAQLESCEKENEEAMRIITEDFVEMVANF